MSEANNWKHTFKDLVQHDGDQIIIYTVKEAPVEGYTSIVSGNMENGFVIVNKPNIPDEPDEPDLPDTSVMGSAYKLIYGALLIGTGLTLTRIKFKKG